MVKIVNKIDTLSFLISPKRDSKKPIYCWNSFKHGFSKELVDIIISEFKVKRGGWVLDPFCGGGTTLLACKDAGINAHGFDILPFSVYLSNIKSYDYDINKLVETKKLLETSNIDFKYSCETISDILIFNKAFSSEIRTELYRIKNQINTIENSRIRDFYNLGLLSILESVSNTSKSGGFLRFIEKDVHYKEIRNIYFKRISEMIDDVASVEKEERSQIIIKAFQGDARGINSDLQYDAIITSPPYPNRHDYTRIYSLEMIFEFVKNNNELKKIRYDSLRSHVEARKKYETINYQIPDLLKYLIKQIESNGVNNPRVIEMIKGYFEDMYLALSEMKKRLLNKGKLALVVSNVRFAGINIPVDILLSEIGDQVGLKSQAIWLARYRGNSSQQMKKYKRVPSRESIIIWEN